MPPAAPLAQPATIAPVLTQHCIDRYRSRVEQHATFSDILATVTAGTVQHHQPGWITGPAWSADTFWIVTGRLAFPCVWQDGRPLVKTTLRKRRVPKADRRAFRLARREEAMFA